MQIDDKENPRAQKTHGRQPGNSVALSSCINIETDLKLVTAEQLSEINVKRPDEPQVHGDPNQGTHRLNM